jgi:hypothetical protein
MARDGGGKMIDEKDLIAARGALDGAVESVTGVKPREELDANGGVGSYSVQQLRLRLGPEHFDRTFSRARSMVSGIAPRTIDQLQGELGITALFEAAADINEARGGRALSPERAVDALRAHKQRADRLADSEFRERWLAGGERERTELTELADRIYSD